MQQQIFKRKYIRKNQRETLGERYEELKQEFEKQKDIDLIQKFRILNEAYEIGKQTYGTFSKEDISKDFDISYETTRRVLSLRRATKKTWGLIANKKISAYKVAQICLTKNIKYQDEVVEEVIKNKYSTRDIDKIKYKSIEELRKFREEKLLKEGYSRKENTFSSFSLVITKMLLFLNMDLEYFSESKYLEIYSKLKNLNKQIGIYLKNNKEELKK